MKWKTFLKPNWKKISIMIVMLLFIPVIPFSLACSLQGDCYAEYSSLIGINYRSLPFVNLSIYIGEMGFVAAFQYIFLILSIAMLFVLYLFSCIIIWIYDKYKKKNQSTRIK